MIMSDIVYPILVGNSGVHGHVLVSMDMDVRGAGIEGGRGSGGQRMSGQRFRGADNEGAEIQGGRDLGGQTFRGGAEIQGGGGQRVRGGRDSGQQLFCFLSLLAYQVWHMYPHSEAMLRMWFSHSPT